MVSNSRAKTHFEHNHRKGINIDSLSSTPGRNTSALCAENLWGHPSNVGRNRLGRSLVAQDSLETILRNTGDPIIVHQDIVLWGCQPLHLGTRGSDPLRSSSRGPNYIDVGRLALERYPTTSIDRGSESFKGRRSDGSSHVPN